MVYAARSIKATPQRLLVCALFLAVATKFLWPLFHYELPLGYDPGIYRYLFVRHAEGFPPFVLGGMDAWAHTHPLGLFFFSTILIRLGVPVDWLIGWIWNLVPIALLLTLSAATARRENRATGALVLLAGLLSAPYYDGFAGMYWKAYAALFFMVLAFHLLERRSPWAAVPAALTLVTHNQTGLLFALVLGTAWLMRAAEFRKDPRLRRATWAALAVVAAAALVYLPVWHESVWMHVKPLLTSHGASAPSGAFPPLSFYLKMNGPLLLLGVAGLALVLRRDRRLSLWSMAALWSAVFVCFRLFFHQRFFLHLDFFLLPFAACAAAALWSRAPRWLWTPFLALLLCIQAVLSLRVMQMRIPDIDTETFGIVQSLEAFLPEDALVLTLENQSTTWVRGWLPVQRVAGPGLFSLPWSYGQWEKLLFGSHAERRELLSGLQGPVYFVLTPLFYEHYGAYAQEFLSDPCFERVEGAPLLRVSCPLP